MERSIPSADSGSFLSHFIFPCSPFYLLSLTDKKDGPLLLQSAYMWLVRGLHTSLPHSKLDSETFLPLFVFLQIKVVPWMKRAFYFSVLWTFLLPPSNLPKKPCSKKPTRVLRNVKINACGVAHLRETCVVPVVFLRSVNITCSFINCCSFFLLPFCNKAYVAKNPLESFVLYVKMYACGTSHIHLPCELPWANKTHPYKK